MYIKQILNYNNYNHQQN